MSSQELSAEMEEAKEVVVKSAVEEGEAVDAESALASTWQAFCGFQEPAPPSPYFFKGRSLPSLLK